MNGPIETKVKAGSIGAAAGGALATFGLWLLGVGVWDASNDADAAAAAVVSVPAPVAGLVLLGVPALVSFLAGRAARHTFRPDLGEHVA
jgi:hypothetical protein